MNYDDSEYEPRPACLPTEHLCGSREKVEIMRIRFEKGESLYHPDDNWLKIELTQYEILKMNSLGLKVIKSQLKRRGGNSSNYDS